MTRLFVASVARRVVDGDGGCGGRAYALCKKSIATISIRAPHGFAHKQTRVLYEMAEP